MHFIRLTTTEQRCVYINFDLVVDFFERKDGGIAGSLIVLDSAGDDYFDVCESPKDIVALIQSSEQQKNRNLFAASALTGILSCQSNHASGICNAEKAFTQADDMISRSIS